MTQLTTISSSSTKTVGAQTQPGSTSDLFGRFSSISTRFADRLKESGVPTNLSANLESLIGGIKNFLPADRDLTVTKMVESIMDPSMATSLAIAKTEHFLYFDPRSANARGTMAPPASAMRAGAGMPGGVPGSTPSSSAAAAAPAPGTGASFGQRRQGFSEAVVFMVGGGSMDEYGNLQEWAKRTGGATGGGGGGGGGSGVGGGGMGGDRARKRVVYGSTEMMNAGQFMREELERLGKEIRGS